jgi:3-oxoacyl-[acyl-carrier protein] reductase
MSRPEKVLSLEGRVAIVTGAGRGIGAATARRLAQAGAFVALLDRDPVTLTQTAEQIALTGGDALSYPVDITDAFAVERIFDRVAEEWERIDVLVNNAGVLREATLEDLDENELQETLDVNLRGAMVCARAVLPHMTARRSGRILSASSVSTRLGASGLTAYAAAKSGIVGMTRTWARELAPLGITANCVAPGLIDSETVRTVPAEELDATLARIPAGRLGTPEEVANVYLFLASDLASFINGAVVSVDGGLLLY